MPKTPPPLRLSGPITVQFVSFLQGAMLPDVDGGQLFVGSVRGMFGVPPDGTLFEARVKLSAGARFTDEAYEVTVPPALAALGARPELRRAAFDYLNGCMTLMFGRDWPQMAGLTVTQDAVEVPGVAVVIDFPEPSSRW